MALAAVLALPLFVLVASGPAEAVPVYEGHYWVGAYFAHDRVDVELMEADITVPTIYPDPSDTYFILISAVDEQMHYDQLGIAAHAGDWTVAWGAIPNCGMWGESFGENYNYGSGTFSLDRGVTYHFAMSIEDSGDVRFEVSRSGALVYGHSYRTYADYIQAEPFTWCWGLPVFTVRGYTAYEEI